MKSQRYYKFRLFLIRFFIIGMMAYIVEVFFTGTINLVKSLHSYFTVPGYVLNLVEATEGHVGIFAFFVYCWAAIPFTFLTNPIKNVIKDNLLFPKLGVLLRGVIYGLIFLTIEFIFGMVSLSIFQTRSWDYSHLPLNVCGVITFLYLPAWILAGMIGEWFHERLVQIDDILLNPKGYNDKGIKIGYKKYTAFTEQKALMKKK